MSIMEWLTGFTPTWKVATPIHSFTDPEIGFTKEAPYIAEKRAKAIEILGDKWILAKKIQKRDTPYGEV